MSVERIVPNTREWEAYYANHICRYMFASRLVQARQATRVLDAACGVGYGSNHLATTTGANVVGVDRSQEALAVAGQHFAGKAIQFLSDDCHTLEAASKHGPYDVIVSFETLEHLAEPKRFLAACSRNLRPGGTLIVSTPNRYVTSPVGKPKNPFHETEYTAEEFVSLLGEARLNNVQLFGQCYTPVGRLRNQVRSEIGQITSNPLFRVGRWLQSTLKGTRFSAVMPESIDDFEVRPFQTAGELSSLGVEGPFVAIGLVAMDGIASR